MQQPPKSCQIQVFIICLCLSYLTSHAGPFQIEFLIWVTCKGAKCPLSNQHRSAQVQVPSGRLQSFLRRVGALPCILVGGHLTRLASWLAVACPVPRRESVTGFADGRVQLGESRLHDSPHFGLVTPCFHLSAGCKAPSHQHGTKLKGSLEGKRAFRESVWVPREGRAVLSPTRGTWGTCRRAPCCPDSCGRWTSSACPRIQRRPGVSWGGLLTSVSGLHGVHFILGKPTLAYQCGLRWANPLRK